MIARQAIGAALLLLALVRPDARGRVEVSERPADRVLAITKVFFFGDVSDYPELKSGFVEGFRRTFGVDLRIQTAPRNTYMEKIQLMITTGELTGMVLPFTPGDVLRMKEDGTILPLDELLEGNAVWSRMPAYFRDAHRYEGRVWAIPSGWSDADPFVRVYRKDWADRLGLDSPRTVDELYRMARAFTRDDPDGNGKDDTVGMVSSGTWNLQDVFQAFDARLNNFGADSIVWDPNENAWVDTMLKPQMVDALRFLARVYSERILDPETFTNKGSTMREKMWSGRYGSTHYWFAWGLESLLPNLRRNVPGAQAGFSLALAGARTRNINHLVAGGGQWVLLSSTPDPRGTLTTFVDVFLGNDRACLWGMYGLEGTTFRIDGDHVIQLRDPATGDLYPGLGITNRLPTWSRDQWLAYPEGSDEETQAAVERRRMRARLIEGGIRDGLLYDASSWKDVCLSPTYTAIISDVRRLFEQLVARAVTGEATAEEVVALYRRELRDMGGQRMLEEANRLVGLTLPPAYRY